MAKKLTYLVWSKIGGLDCILPLFWSARQNYPDVELTIFIAELNKEAILRNGKFYMEFAQQYNIQLLDKLDFLPFWLRPFKNILQKLTRIPTRDRVNLSQLTKNLHAFLIQIIERLLVHNKIKLLLDVDLLLVNEDWWDKLDRDILKIIAQYNKKIFLVPHGAIFLATPTDLDDMNKKAGYSSIEKCFYFETRNGMGSYYIESDHDMKTSPYPFISTEVKMTSIEKSLLIEMLGFVGYPSFDRVWLDKVVELLKTSPRFQQFNRKKSSSLRCLFIMRDVAHTDYSTYAPNEYQPKFTRHNYLTIFRTIAEEVLKNHDVELLIKPHPRQNSDELKGLLDIVGIKSYMIVQDMVPITLYQSDFAITFQTSGSYYALIYGIPAIHIYKCDYPNQPLFNEMEQNLQRVVFNLDDLGGACRALMDDLTNGRPIPNDTAHMRKYYPDGATELIMEQLRPYLED